MNLLDEMDIEGALDEILLKERNAIIQSGIWFPTEDTRNAEKWLDKLYFEILNGAIDKLDEFEKGCRWWRESGQNLREGEI
jgi:hypothetical protein